MQVRSKINVQVFDDSDAKNPLFAMADTTAEVRLDGFTKYTSGKFSVLSGANENLSLGDITTVRGFWIQADNDFNLTLNGGSAIAMKVGKTGGIAKGALECTVSSLNVAAPGAVTVTGTYVVYGDPAA